VTNKLLDSEAFAGRIAGAARHAAGRIGHLVSQRTDCFFLPLYPLTNIWSNGTV
jgi:hypothetical protein